MLGFLVNVYVLHATADIVSCVTTYGISKLNKLREYGICFPYNGGFPLDRVVLEFWVARFFVNLLFWSFIVWLVLMGVRKLKKKQGTIQTNSNFDQKPQV